MFQFHKGTIRTQMAADKLTEVASFNSIKVRLEPLPPFGKCGLHM